MSGGSEWSEWSNKYLSILRLKLPIFHFKSHILEPYFLKTDQFVFRFFSIILSS